MHILVVCASCVGERLNIDVESFWGEGVSLVCTLSSVLGAPFKYEGLEVVNQDNEAFEKLDDVERKTSKVTVRVVELVEISRRRHVPGGCQSESSGSDDGHHRRFHQRYRPYRSLMS